MLKIKIKSKVCLKNCLIDRLKGLSVWCEILLNDAKFTKGVSVAGNLDEMSMSVRPATDGMASMRRMSAGLVRTASHRIFSVDSAGLGVWSGGVCMGAPWGALVNAA